MPFMEVVSPKKMAYCAVSRRRKCNGKGKALIPCVPMASWEEELDLDVSDIWSSASKPVATVAAAAATPQQREDDGFDDLAFTPDPRAQSGSQTAWGGRSQDAVPEHETRSQPERGDADAETQLASLTTQPLLSGAPPRRPSQIPTAREDDPPPHPPSPPAPMPRTSKDRPAAAARAPAQPPDIRRYFAQTSGTATAADEPDQPQKKRRIPGPVGDFAHRDGGSIGSPRGDGNVSTSERGDCGDEVFRSGAWLAALESLNVEEFDPARYAILKATASSIRTSGTPQQVPHLVAVIKELTANIYGDAAVVLKDPTGTVPGVMNNKVFSDSEFGKVIAPGAVIVLRKVALFSPAAHYLNITVNNVVQVFAVETSLPQGPKVVQQQQQADEGGAAVAKLAGWDATDDMEALLNDDVNDFYA